MDFGMLTDFHVRPGGSQPEAFEESFRQVKAAETMGLDSVWLGEHHFTPDRSVLASPLTIASAIATATSRVRIGLAVQVLPLGNPLRMAEEAATVDQISKGRLDFGVGRSGLTRYYQGYNIPYVESRERFFESLDIIIKAWTQERFSHEGQYYSYNDVTLVPRPYQMPHPPIRVAVASAATFALMGSRGFPIFCTTTAGMDELEARFGEYRRAYKEAGHPGEGNTTLRMPVHVAETDRKARNEAQESIMCGVRRAATDLAAVAASQELADRLREAANRPYEQIVTETIVCGSPEHVKDRLLEYRERLGATGVVMELNYGGRIPYDRVENSIRLLAENVMPSFK
jgi:alkanesulfonate monooxygenase SsuD/methylene tetrahydromethanopterin reductase-like flavin-dependent oxidoreductase (luciferase family)